MRQATTKDARVQIGPYLVEDVLGDGATGIVYRVRDPHGRTLALKLLRQELALSEKERQRFLDEAERLRRVRHPALVEVVDAGILPSHGLPYIAMPYYEGCSLAARMQRGPLRFDVALALFEQLASALHALHYAGLVHRDIKPENIFVVAGDRQAILLDLGIARDVNASPSTTTHAGMIRGTPAYMAPERFFGAPATPATDIYELGVVLYMTLVGVLPWMRFDDPTERMKPAPPAARGVVLPERLTSTLMRALAVSPSDRPQSASDFASAVIDALSPESVQMISNQPTAYAHRMTPPPASPAAYAPTALQSSSGIVAAPSYAQAPPPVFTPPPPGATLQPPAASGPRKKMPAMLIGALTGATLLGTGGLAVALFVVNANQLSAPPAVVTTPPAEAPAATASNRPPPPVAAIDPIAADPNLGRSQRREPPKARSPLPNTVATGTGTGANKTPEETSTSGSRANTGPVGSTSKPRDEKAKRFSNVPVPEIPSKELRNCNNLTQFLCREDVRKELGNERCSRQQFRVQSTTREEFKLATDGSCAAELRSLAAE